MNDENIMNIVDEVFKEIEVDDIIEEMGGYRKSSDYLMTVTVSVINENLTEISEKIITNSQINALNGRTKQCATF